jgi:hypothetical protein
MIEDVEQARSLRATSHQPLELAWCVWSSNSKGGILLAAIAAKCFDQTGFDQTGFDQTGMTSGLLLGNFAIVASLTFRCCATIAGGVRVTQSDSETSAK